MSNTIKQLQWRYATKKFDNSKILSLEKLNILKQAFNLTATSYGLQTIKMLVVKDKSIRAKLVAHSYNQKQVAEASHLLVICIQENIVDNDINTYYDNIKNIRDTPETILKPYREGLMAMVSKMSKEERQQWSTKQAYIALGNLMTVCALEKIDACPMEGFVPSKYDEILELEAKGLKSVLLLPVGYRAEDDMFSEFKKVRKPINEAVIEL
ncbi:Nitroreductase [Hyunsoonleella jejuensis]|uniref:Nitroreductase n=1 Tax=Hyunsoonleella jejuensis TaxID=419940 RepID=A0A1H9KE72_9FLAO|nr:NAD(P)H-dependent oxidoreductase [Hyunsoonleella jejuensis]SEQ97163.1 Nitroreductase [Hyunsoonleella jejuensis]